MWRTILRLLEALFVPVLAIIVSVSGPAHTTFRVGLVKIAIVLPITILFLWIVDNARESRIEECKERISGFQTIKSESTKDPVIVPVKVKRISSEE
jgi:hypothetical protein